MVDLTFASFVTRSSTLIGFATRNEVERIEEGVEGAKANAADAEQSAVTTAREENCMVRALLMIQYRHTGFYELLFARAAGSQKVMDKISKSVRN